MYIPEFWCGVIFTVIFEAVVIMIESFYVKSKNNVKKERRTKLENNNNSSDIEGIGKDS